jgi:hypothetical protein
LLKLRGFVIVGWPEMGFALQADSSLYLPGGDDVWEEPVTLVTPSVELSCDILFRVGCLVALQLSANPAGDVGRGGIRD